MTEKRFSEKLINNRIPFLAEAEPLASDNPSPMPNDEAERLREFSIRFKQIFRGETNAEIARRLGTTDAVVKNYVEAKRFPNDKLLFSITRATGVNLHWLLTGKGSRRVENEVKIFDEGETARIEELARLHRRSFDEEVRALTVAAVKFIEKIG